MTCKMCRERGKTWIGDDPQCAFDSFSTFSSVNWNCATMNALRDIADRHFAKQACIDETSAVVIPFKSDSQSGFIVLSWYKRRGATGTALVVFDDNEPHTINERDALDCIAYHERA